MIVCSCFGVSGDDVERLVEAGAETVAEVSSACGAGSDCGACRQHVAEIIAVARLLAHRPPCSARCRAHREPAAHEHAPESTI